MKIALVSFILLAVALAANKKETTSQSKEIIEIAQNLILQKDRDQATRLLIKAVISEKNKKVQQEIKLILRDLGSLFLYDKSQQEYELSVSFKKADPTKWIAAIERAQKIEPDNTLIVMEIIRNHVNKKSIEKAKEALDEAYAKNPFDRNMILAALFLALANKDNKEINNLKLRLKDLQLPNYEAIVAYVDFLEKMANQNNEKALSSLVSLKKEDPQNPQIGYWENRLSNRPEPAADMPCASVPEHLYRRYTYDLFFCSPLLGQYFKIKETN